MARSSKNTTISTMPFFLCKTILMQTTHLLLHSGTMWGFWGCSARLPPWAASPTAPLQGYAAAVPPSPPQKAVVTSHESSPSRDSKENIAFDATLDCLGSNEGLAISSV